MSAYIPVDLIEVRSWGRSVGALAYDSRLGINVFEYTPEWISKGVELSPLHMPNRSGTYTFPQLSRETFHGLPAMVADALPDSFGNAVIDAWLAAQGVDKSEIKALDRLAYAGQRALGALTFHPAKANLGGPATAVQVADIVAGARLVLAGEAVKGNSEHDALMQLIQVGSSAGGARAKAVIQYQPKTQQFRSGYLSAEPGFEPWLMKLDGVSKSADGSINSLDRAEEFTRIEYAYYLMALAAGINMSQSLLYEEGSRAHFLTRRFDRSAVGEPIHLQSLCAIDHLDFRYRDTHDYAQYFSVIRKLGMGTDELNQGFRRMVFNVVAMNRDDHTKNVGFLLPERGRWTLAPAYDLTHAFNPRGQWTQRHQMGINAKFDQITLADFYAVGSAQGITGYKSLIKEVSAAVGDWEIYALAAGLNEESRKRVAQDITQHRPQ